MNIKPLLKKLVGAKEGVSVVEQSAVTISPVSVRKNHLLGVTLAFCVEERAIQMAAVLHLGSIFKILDVRKNYLPQSVSATDSHQAWTHEVIGEFTRKHARRGSRVVITLPGNKVVFRTFLMPELKATELAAAIEFEVRKVIPFPVEESFYAYRPISRVTGRDRAKLKIALQAATRSDVNQALSYFQHTDSLVDHVYYNKDVIGQLLKYLEGFNEEQNYTLLNIGLSGTMISFYKGSSLEFTLASNVSSSMLGAKPDKTRYEFFAESIANEIQNSLDFYSGQFATTYSSRLFVYGDLAYTSELLQRINEKGGVSLEVFPVEKLTFLNRRDLEYPEIFPTCLPALSAAVNTCRLADLLPPPQRKTLNIIRTNRYLKIAAAAIVALALLSWFYLNDERQIKQVTLSTYNRQVEAFRNSDAFHSYNIIKREIAYHQQYLNETKQPASYFSLNLKELSRLTPTPIRLLNLDFTPSDSVQNLFLQGIVRSQDVPPEVVLAEYIEDLNASPFYENVKLMRHSKKRLDGSLVMEFSLKLRGVS